MAVAHPSQANSARTTDDCQQAFKRATDWYSTVTMHCVGHSCHGSHVHAVKYALKDTWAVNFRYMSTLATHCQLQAQPRACMSTPAAAGAKLSSDMFIFSPLHAALSFCCHTSKLVTQFSFA